jgi:cytochrome P450
VLEVLAWQRRRGEMPGLFASLLAARECDQLTETELTGLAASLFFDGHILAAAQIANAVLCLLLHPDQFGQVRADPALIRLAAEEVLRWSPSITLGMTRLARPPADQAASVAFGVVNRDTAVFNQPERFTVTRQPNRHLSFGCGRHHCLGAHLMRIELLVALHAVLSGLDRVQLAIAEHRLLWSASRTVRAVTRLPLHWTR